MKSLIVELIPQIVKVGKDKKKSGYDLAKNIRRYNSKRIGSFKTVDKSQRYFYINFVFT